MARRLTRALQDRGLELTPAADRLNAFNAVQNTYLDTFQMLGALGLLLGSAGLGVVVLRNVLERRGELASAGRRRIHPRAPCAGWWSASTRVLQALGLLLGMLAAWLAVLPGLAFALGPAILSPAGGDTGFGVCQRPVLDLGRRAPGPARGAAAGVAQRVEKTEKIMNKRALPMAWPAVVILLLTIAAGAPESGKTLYENNFQKAAPGPLPDSEFLVLDGDFSIKESGGNKYVELPGAPLDTFGVLFGPTTKAIR